MSSPICYYSVNQAKHRLRIHNIDNKAKVIFHKSVSHRKLFERYLKTVTSF